jgi:hypothetical protein
MEKKLSIKEIQQLIEENKKITIESEKSTLIASKIGENIWKLELYSATITNKKDRKLHKQKQTN